MLQIRLIYFICLLISLSSAASLSVDPHWPQMFSGEQLTLSCEVHRAESWGSYEWSKSGQSLHHTQSHITIRNTAPTDSGSYSCRGVLDHTVTQWICFLLSNTVSLTLDPKWPEVFVGETLTLRCEVEGSGDGWTYDWSRNNELLTKTTRENTVSYVTESDRGDFSCRGVSFYLTTQWSSTTTVNVLNKPVARVSADPELQTGGSVTLSCSVSPSSSGWKYENKQLFTHGSSELRVSEGGEYQCRAFRGDPPYFTELSPSFKITTAGQFVKCLCCSYYTCGFIQNINKKVTKMSFQMCPYRFG
uniref:Ig-like domain-containing protein n=1 Tax=Neogobius melanostomus TaxID=47308 RepID=A0A8C6WHR4_9GOBI